MANAATYTAAAIPEPRRVLGLLLRPFCLGHYLILQRFDSAFVDSEPREVTREDIILTALVCSFTYEEFWEFIRQEDAPEKIEEWGKKFGLFSLKEKAQLLDEYIREAQQLPAIVFEEETKASGSHWSQNLSLTLTGHLGYSHSEALNRPLQKAWADMLKYAETLSHVRFLTEDELKQIEALN